WRAVRISPASCVGFEGSEAVQGAVQALLEGGILRRAPNPAVLLHGPSTVAIDCELSTCSGFGQNNTQVPRLLGNPDNLEAVRDRCFREHREESVKGFSRERCSLRT